MRLAIVEAIEEAGNVPFEWASKLAAFECETGVEQRFLRRVPLQAGVRPGLNGDHAELARIDLDEASRVDAIQRVAKVFGRFTDWTQELPMFALLSQNDTPSNAKDPVTHLSQKSNPPERCVTTLPDPNHERDQHESPAESACLRNPGRALNGARECG